MQALTAAETEALSDPLPPPRNPGWSFGIAQLLLFALGLATLAFTPALPPGLAAIPVYGPIFCIVVAVALAIPFNRGRAALAAGGLGFVYALHLTGVFSSRPAFLLAALLVPANLAVLAALRERGALSRHALRRALFLAVQAGFAAWAVSQGLWQVVLAASPPILVVGGHSLPPVVLAVSGLAALVGAVVFWARGTAIDAALWASVVTCVTGFWMIDVPHGLPVLFATAALGIAVGVLQDAHRFAFVDELTGLPGRRALEEKLLALPDRFAIAMVDVDHFKRVNDDHGHDTGDQVLRMIAAHLAHVGNGARAYRYGGEEFAVVFPDRSAREAVPELEALRANVAGYVMRLRTDARTDPRVHAADGPEMRRSKPRAPGGLRVTISIGVAERNRCPGTSSTTW
jgi:diguanylate cyclase (GGDEF)-like protein